MRSWHLPTPVDTSTPNNALTEGACARNHIALRRRPQLERRTRVSTQQHTRSVRSLAASFQSARAVFVAKGEFIKRFERGIFPSRDAVGCIWQHCNRTRRSEASASVAIG
jgi:hypothetical protein